MQVSVETTEGLERKMTVAVPSYRVDSAVNERLQERMKKGADMPGWVRAPGEYNWLDDLADREA